VADVAAITGLCYRTIHRAIRDGRIKAVRLGGSVMISAAQLRRICEEGY
jgi:excisionase family DNA binding protein